jgi:malate dehydrogenase
VLSCAAYLNGEYDVKDLYVGVPAVIGSKGVERIVEISLNGTERTMFEKSAKAVATLVDACRMIAPHLAKAK